MIIIKIKAVGSKEILRAIKINYQKYKKIRK